MLIVPRARAANARRLPLPSHARLVRLPDLDITDIFISHRHSSATSSHISLKPVSISPPLLLSSPPPNPATYSRHTLLFMFRCHIIQSFDIIHYYSPLFPPPSLGRLRCPPASSPFRSSSPRCSSTLLHTTSNIIIDSLLLISCHY